MRAARQAPAPSVQSMHIPAPIGGLNTMAAGKAMPDGDCPLLYNMLSGEHGLRVRLGSKEYAGYTAQGSPSDATLGRTLIGYQGSQELYDRLFVVTTSGIWDCSGGYGVASVHSVTFATQSGKAGFGIWHAFVTAAGHFLLYCDEENGYHVYTESTDTWAKVTLGADPATQVAGVDPASFCFVTSFKSRLWFVQKNTKLAWYLPAGAIFGTATSLNLDRSAQFRRGGDLVGLWNWTLDGGFGMDDYLVAIGRGGDVVVYQGTDPAAAATFSLKGVWNAGALVAGRRIVMQDGGDLLILSRSGPRPLSQLVSGGDGAGTYATGKVGNLFARMAYERGELDRWDMFIHPDENALIITVPVPGTEYTEFFAMSLYNRSWSICRDLQMSSACVWRKRVHFSWVNSGGFGSLFTSEGHVDFQGGAAAMSLNSPIQWSVITPFRSLDGRNVQVKRIRPNFISQDGVPAWEANARYNYNLAELSAVAIGAPGGAGSWDVGTWDSALWQSELGTADYRSRGATGSGRDFAIALRGTANGHTVLVGVDVFFQVGGQL